jgi:hypothetical protein
MTDTGEVILWTVIAVVLSLAACAVGYAYRRMRGMDHPTPDEIEMMSGGHGHDEHAETTHEAATPAPAHH